MNIKMKYGVSELDMEFQNGSKVRITRDESANGYLLIQMIENDSVKHEEKISPDVIRRLGGKLTLISSNRSNEIIDKL